MPVPIIQVKNLTKYYGGKKVLDSIDLSIFDREFYVVIGLNGSGKTTLLNHMVGFITPDAGDILIQNFTSHSKELVSIYPNLRKTRRFIGFSPQEPSFYPELSCLDNMAYFGGLYQIAEGVMKKNAKMMLKLVGLWDVRQEKVGNLSGGMQKRFDIALALIHDPQILILDEPTSDLDPILRKQIMNIIHHINRSGKTVIISSHLLTEIESICDRLCILYQGRVVKSGTPDQLKVLYTKDEEIRLETSPGKYGAMMDLLKKHKDTVKINRMEIKEHQLIIYTPNAEKGLHDILHFMEHSKETLIDVTVNKPTLKEVMEYLIQKGNDGKDI